jgi:hypothetical protein
MPSLYGSTTTYVVTASNVSTLYLGSTTTFTATTYSTNLAGLYGGSYAALPTNAEQLIQLFDNNGNVHFYLDPLTNSATIYASFVGTGTISLGNFVISGDSIIDQANNSINIVTNGQTWTFENNGQLTSPQNGTFGDTYLDGSGAGVQAPPSGYAIINSNNQQQFVQVDDSQVSIGTDYPTSNFVWGFDKQGFLNLPANPTPQNVGPSNGQLSDQYWVAPPNGQINLTNNTGTNYVWLDDYAVYIENGYGLPQGGHWQFNQDGTTQFPHYTFPSAGGTAGQVLVDDGTGNLAWTTLETGPGNLIAGTGIAISTSTSSATITNIGVTHLTAGSGISVSTSTGSVTVTNSGVRSITAGTGTFVSAASGNITIWTTGGSTGTVSTAYDFGTILAPVSYTLDMGPIIV